MSSKFLQDVHASCCRQLGCKKQKIDSVGGCCYNGQFWSGRNQNECMRPIFQKVSKQKGLLLLWSGCNWSRPTHNVCLQTAYILKNWTIYKKSSNVLGFWVSHTYSTVPKWTNILHCSQWLGTVELLLGLWSLSLLTAISCDVSWRHGHYSKSCDCSPGKIYIERVQWGKQAGRPAIE